MTTSAAPAAASPSGDATVTATRLRAAVDALARTRPADLPGPVALADAALLLAELDRLRAVVAARLADVDRRQLHVLDGAGSVGRWVDARGSGVDRAEVALARKLDRLPAVAARLADGGLGLPAAVAVGQALDRVRRHLDRPDGLVDGLPGEEVLRAVVVDGVSQVLAEARGGYRTADEGLSREGVDEGEDDPRWTAVRDELEAVAALPCSQAARLERALCLLAARIDPVLLAGALHRLVDALLPVQLEDRADRARRDRAFHLRLNADRTGWLARGELDLGCGELLATALAAVEQVDPDAPADTAARAAGRAYDQQHDRGTLQTGTPLPPAARSRAQRAHDALGLLVRRALDAGVLGLRGKTAPHVVVTTGLGALRGEPGALPAVGRTSGASWPAGRTRALACSARLTRVVLSLGRRPLELSHTQRTASAAERELLAVRWGGRCATAGCGRGPGAVLHPHHGEAFARTGSTALADTWPLCDTCHDDLHVGGTTLRLRDGTLLGPDGVSPPPDP